MVFAIILLFVLAGLLVVLGWTIWDCLSDKEYRDKYSIVMAILLGLLWIVITGVFLAILLNVVLMT